VTRLRLVPYRRLRLAAERAGYAWIRRDGNHNVFRNPGGRTVVIPDHGSQVIVRPLLHKILRDLGMSVEEYDRALDEI
jgi:predicted RNA binding protein YcfA (HicA-like mRNA interferase family)